MTLAMPHSTVNASNYDTLGNQLKGESHSSRMKRVNAMRRSEEEPTLQPLGSVVSIVNRIDSHASGLERWGGPFFLAAILGAVVGLAGRADNPAVATAMSKKVNRKSAIIAATFGGIASLYSTKQRIQPSNTNPEKIIKYAAVAVGSAAAAGLAHGMGRGSANWL